MIGQQNNDSDHSEFEKEGDYDRSRSKANEAGRGL